MSDSQLKGIIEGAIMASDQPLSIKQLLKLFAGEESCPSVLEIQQQLQVLKQDYQGRAVELKEVASGYRFQISQEVSPWVQRLWQERPPKYTRALLETLALIVYRQPITRAEIEDIRGVTVSTNIIKTLVEREWIRIIGHKEIPGRPALYATTKRFLDDFNLKGLIELPPLSELQDFQKIEASLEVQLNLPVLKPAEQPELMHE